MFKIIIFTITLFLSNQSFAQSGWSSSNTTSNSGIPMCYMTTENDSNQLYFKYFRGAPRIIIHTFNMKWLFQPVEQIPISVVIDGVTVWNGIGGGAFDSTEISITNDNQIETLFSRFISGRNISIIVNNESTSFSLVGSANAFSVFSRCIRDISRERQQEPLRPRYRT